MEKQSSGIFFLRAMEPEDEKLLYDIENRPEAFLTGENRIPFSRYSLQKFIFSSLRETFLSSGQLRLIACRKTDAENPDFPPPPVAVVDFFHYEALYQRAELGLLVLETYRNRGIGKKIVELACSYAQKQLNLHQLYIEIRSDNARSIRLFKSCGFENCGKRKDWLRSGKEWMSVESFQKIFE